MQHWDYVRGWCLVKDEEVELSYLRDVMGSLYYCPYCGGITERYDELQHVIDPSGPLLERLRNTTKHGCCIKMHMHTGQE
jgi:hypothetical protein